MKNYVCYPSETKGWSVIKGELCEVELMDVNYLINLSGDALEQKTLLVQHQGESHSVEPANYYASEEDYRAGKTMECIQLHFPHVKAKAELVGDGFDFWTMVDGIPAKKHQPITWAHRPTNEELVFPELLDLNTIYKTREECLAWSEYIVSFKDGHKEPRKGAGLLLQLTDEQREVVTTIEQEMRKADSLGIRIFSLYGDIYAINTKGLENFEFAYSGDRKFQKEQGLTEEFDVLKHEFLCKCNVYDIGEDSVLFFKRKQA